VLLLVSILGTAWLVFTDALPLASRATPLAALCLAPLLWAGFRFSPREVSTGTVLLAGAAIRGALHRAGPFAGATPNETLLLLQSFLGIVSVMALVVAAQVRQSRSIATELHAVREDLERRVEERTRVLSSAAAERRRSDEKFHDLLEAAPDAMVIADPEGRIVQVNARTEMMFGAPRTELLGGRIDDLLAERYRGPSGGLRDSGPITARLRSMGEGGELFGQRRDGSEFPIDISVSPLETEQGTMLTAAIRDITRRLQSEESVARLAAIVASSDDAIVSTDPEGVITSWNAAAERLLGYTVQEVLGRSSAILAAPGVPGETERAEKLKRLKQVRYDSRSMRKDGTVVDVGITSFPVRDRSGRTIGYSSILRDLTEQRRAEQERHEKDALQSQVSELSSRTHEISVLNELGDVLRSAVRPAEAYPVIPRFLRELFPGESGALYEFNEGHQLMETVMSWGDAPPQEDAFLPSECWGLRRGQTHLVDDPQGSMLCQHARAPMRPGALCIPLTARGKTLGLLHLMGAPDGKAPSAEGAVAGEYRQRLAQTVAQQISSALFDLRLQETLRDQATRDPLTGLFNRRYMEETLHRELYRAARKKTRVGFVLFDLDHFKSYNDRHGHASGDAALREVSAFVQRHSRAEDIVCRYGGEEFLLVLSDCSSADLVRRAEQIRQGVKALRLEHNQRDLGTITLSAGVALFPDHGRTVDELFQVADAALYQAKKDGRDRVTIADALPSVMVPPRPGERERQH
jgi:diguanylate cyclase (GGDEF)-like protein/PAS domain S-box-containing protein